MSIFKVLKAYHVARNKLFDHVGFAEDWAVHPIDDKTEYQWFIRDNDSLVFFDPSKPAGGMNHFSSPLFETRAHPKNIYVGEELTMVFENTQTDGNRFWTFLDNDNRIEPVVPKDGEEVEDATFDKWNHDNPR